jgi:hypothetical protein
MAEISRASMELIAQAIALVARIRAAAGEDIARAIEARAPSPERVEDAAIARQVTTQEDSHA